MCMVTSLSFSAQQWTNPLHAKRRQSGLKVVSTLIGTNTAHSKSVQIQMTVIKGAFSSKVSGMPHSYWSSILASLKSTDLKDLTKSEVSYLKKEKKHFGGSKKRGVRWK